MVSPPLSDPNGTLSVARGNYGDNDMKERRRLIKLSKKDAVQVFLQDHATEERLHLLRKDDRDPNIKKLSQRQRHALQKRRQLRQNKHQQSQQHHKRLQAAVSAAQAQELLQGANQVGSLEAENDMERTTALTQAQLKHMLDKETSRHIYDLTLPQTAPYGMKYDRSGRYSVLFGQNKGHLALMDNQQRTLQTEFYVHERVRDACFLHNASLFAVAQKNHAYIYDHTGAEVHRLADHTDPFTLSFLPHHWLLATIGRQGWLKYQDTSTGQLVSQHRTGLGPCSVLRQNASNGVMHTGHYNGTVSLWSPAQSTYLAKMLCHKGSTIHSIAVDGHHLVTGAADKQVMVWDLRNYQKAYAYYTASGVPTSLDISQRGMLGIGHATHATIWKDVSFKQKDPYMHHHMPQAGSVETLRFCPYQDVCAIGHGLGISSVVIPGSGEPALDTTEYHTNPFSDAKQRREAEVRALLDKLDPAMITLEGASQVGGMEASDPHVSHERLLAQQEAANAKQGVKKKQKKNKRGRSKIQVQLRRKQRNVVDEHVLKLREAREREKTEAEERREAKSGVERTSAAEEEVPDALRRFFS